MPSVLGLSLPGLEVHSTPEVALERRAPEGQSPVCFLAGHLWPQLCCPKLLAFPPPLSLSPSCLPLPFLPLTPFPTLFCWLLFSFFP